MQHQEKKDPPSLKQFIQDRVIKAKRNIIPVLRFVNFDIVPKSPDSNVFDLSRINLSDVDMIKSNISNSDLRMMNLQNTNMI